MMPSTRLSRFLHAHLLPLGISAVLLALAGIGSLLANDATLFANAALNIGFLVALSWISFA
ncbi:MAG TPA: hypothetical protein P5256_16210 [Beijerinckiaceae bacterium]|nr:hypothetical protein [Beijerinckiaceae bacterium]